MLRKSLLPVLMVVAVLTSQAVAQQNASSDQTSAERLSPAALDALVSGVAFYPDKVVEQALAAAFYPQAIQQAVSLSPDDFQRQQNQFSDSIRFLRYEEPALLVQLNQHLSLTARLGLAAQTQLEDVWAAIDRVRDQYAAAQQQDGQAAYTEQGVASGYYTTATPYYPHGRFVAGWVTAGVVNELNHVHPVGGANVYYGPNGGAAATTTGGVVYQNGNTTAAVGAGSGTVQGPHGNTAHVTAQGAAAATTQGNTTYFGSQGSGSISTSTGLYANGQHSGSGAVTHQADGSTSFGRNGTTSVNSSYGSTTVDHSGSGAVTGNGTGSYQGSTDVTSTHGNASVSTQAGGGQASSTVTTAGGQQTFVAGDGQVGGSGNPARSGTQRPGPASSSNAWVNTLGSSQRKATSQLMSQSWGKLTASAPAANRARGNDVIRAGQGAAARPTSRATTRPATRPATRPTPRTQPTVRTPGIQRSGTVPNRYSAPSPSRRTTPSRSHSRGGRGGRGGGRR